MTLHILKFNSISDPYEGASWDVVGVFDSKDAADQALEDEMNTIFLEFKKTVSERNEEMKAAFENIGELVPASRIRPEPIEDDIFEWLINHFFIESIEMNNVDRVHTRNFLI